LSARLAGFPRRPSRKRPISGLWKHGNVIRSGGYDRQTV
jgi:hypothetical protein